MQTFLPYPDFVRSAIVLDDMRLGKQRVEAMQIYNTLLCLRYQVTAQPLDCGEERVWRSATPEQYDATDESCRRKTPWYNHPAVRMWRGGYERTLAQYGYVMCLEWIARGRKDSLLQWFFDRLYLSRASVVPAAVPPWFGNIDFHLAHQSNLLRKDPDYYRPIFGHCLSDALEYVWPV